jgi:hypothetical protein
MQSSSVLKQVVHIVTTLLRVNVTCLPFIFGFDSRHSKFFLLHSGERVWGPPSGLPNGYWGLFPRGVKRPGREADHSPPASADVNNDGALHPFPPYVFMT